MKVNILIMGLPLNTLIIVGGLFVLSMFLPTIIALILKYLEDKKQ